MILCGSSTLLQARQSRRLLDETITHVTHAKTSVWLRMPSDVSLVVRRAGGWTL